eukprot:2766127-Pyramimonas_sp.AAC.1
MSQAKQAIARGRLKRNEGLLEDASSETSKGSRMSQAKRETARGCLKRNERFARGYLKRGEQFLEDVSSETSNSPAPARDRY